MEAFYDGRWGPVCSSSWGSSDARVVWGELGFNRNDASSYFYWVREGCVCMCARVCNEGGIRPPRIIAGTLLHSLLLAVPPSFSPSLPPSFLLSLPLYPLSLLPYISTSIESNLKPIWLTRVTCSSAHMVWPYANQQ